MVNGKTIFEIDPNILLDKIVSKNNLPTGHLRKRESCDTKATTVYHRDICEGCDEQIHPSNYYQSTVVP